MFSKNLSFQETFENAAEINEELKNHNLMVHFKKLKLQIDRFYIFFR